jgi:hypothetical protein
MDTFVFINYDYLFSSICLKLFIEIPVKYLSIFDKISKSMRKKSSRFLVHKSIKKSLKFLDDILRFFHSLFLAARSLFETEGFGDIFGCLPIGSFLQGLFELAPSLTD